MTNYKKINKESMEAFQLFFLMSEAYRMGMVSDEDYKGYIKECMDAILDREVG